MSAFRATDPAPLCRICGGARMERIVAREMMLGLRERFLYLECADCGCVQIAELPDDLARFYPPQYYAFAAEAVPPSVRHRLKAWLLDRPGFWRLWTRLGPTRRWLASGPVAALYPPLLPSRAARILDVGAGDGRLVGQLRELGYRSALGIDAFIAADIVHHGRLLVRKAELADIAGRFDCISFHHVLEHLPDQAGTLDAARALLAPGGCVLLRLPVVGGEAWRRWRENWVHFDAPRHTTLHSPKSLALLAGQCGFEVASLAWDSDGMQFWGSELYARDIPLTDPRSPATPGPSLFSAEELAGFEARAHALNAAGDGDQVSVVLKPMPAGAPLTGRPGIPPAGYRTPGARRS